MPGLFSLTSRTNWHSRGARARLAGGFLLSGLFLCLAFRKADISAVVSTLTSVQPLYLVPLLGLLFLSFFLRAWRWRFLMGPVKTIALHSLFSSTMVGFMANNLLPLRAGEVVRAYSLARKEGIAMGTSLATVVLDRLFDGLILSFCLLLLLLSLPFPPWLVQLNYLLLGLYLGGLGVLGFLAVKGRWDGFLSGRFHMVRHFISGLAVLRRRGQLLGVFLLSLALWLVSACFYFLLFFACHLSLPFFAALVLLVVVAIGVSLPAAPGHIGNFHYFAVLALSLFSVSREEALGFSLLAHVLQFVPVIVVGLVYAMREGAARLPPSPGQQEVRTVLTQ